MDDTKAVMKELAQSLVTEYKEQPELTDKIRFGLVGYRDNAEKIPAMEFTAKNFTAEGLVDAATLGRLLDTEAKAAIAGSKDYDEDVYAGIKLATTDIQWNPSTLKVLVLVGDASAHEADDEKKTTELDAQRLPMPCRRLTYPKRKNSEKTLNLSLKSFYSA